MGYKAVFDACHKIDQHVPRNTVKAEVLAATGINTVRVLKTGLDTSRCRGFYVSARNNNHRLVQQFGGHIVVLARDMNRCWDRFVMIKELMHLFDGVEEAADSGDDFEALLSEFMEPADYPSPQMRSELKCFWRALGVLCPEHQRQEFIKERARLDDYAIALRLRIPQLYVRHLFSPRYQSIIDDLMD